jgi:hypothetical protein
MYARARYKLDIDDKVIQAGRFDNKSTQEEQEEFLVGVAPALSRNEYLNEWYAAVHPRSRPRGGERRGR